MRFPRIQVLLIFAVLLVSQIAIAGNVTIVYPTKEEPLFSIAVPEDWELTPAEEAGGFFDIEGPTGAVLSFRAFAGTEADLEAAIDEAVAFLSETYKDVKLGDPAESTLDGMPALHSAGSGTGEDGSSVGFDMVWAAMENGNIAELWFVTTVGDKQGVAQARAIVNSFKGQ